MVPATERAHELWNELQQLGGLVSQAEIAQRFNVSDAYISKSVRAQRFPEPVVTIGRRSMWLWPDVQEWRASGPRYQGFVNSISEEFGLEVDDVTWSDGSVAVRVIGPVSQSLRRILDERAQVAGIQLELVTSEA